MIVSDIEAFPRRRWKIVAFTPNLLRIRRFTLEGGTVDMFVPVELWEALRAEGYRR